jgi:hypothetical protein
MSSVTKRSGKGASGPQSSPTASASPQPSSSSLSKDDSDPLYATASGSYSESSYDFDSSLGDSKRSIHDSLVAKKSAKYAQTKGSFLYDLVTNSEMVVQAGLLFGICVLAFIQLPLYPLLSRRRFLCLPQLV